jgi:hypothetical protein
MKKGITLVEVVLTIALVSLIMIPIVSMLTLGGRSQSTVAEDFSVQSDIRVVSQKLSNYIKKSNAVFLHKTIEDVFTSDIYPENTNKVTLNQSFIDASTSKSELEAAIEKYKGWNFIVLSLDGKELREFVYNINPTTNEEYYTMERIMNMDNSDSNLSYEIEYKMKNSHSEDKLLEFLLVGNYPGGTSEYISIKSEVEALNSLQVVDRGDNVNPATVLFYRSDDRPIGYDAKAAVSMVLDVSGSMARNMDGKNGGTSRISILKDKSKKLLNSMAELDIDVTLVPFSNYAYNSWTWTEGNWYNKKTVTKDLDKFYNIQSEKSELDNIIDNLSTKSGTNVGDGIRRAYYRFDDYNSIVNEDDDDSIENKDATKYMILLMDGVPTFGSIYKTNFYNGKYSNIEFVLSDEKIEDIEYGENVYNYIVEWGGNYYYDYFEYDKYYEYYYFGSRTYFLKKDSKTNNSLGFYSGFGHSSDDELSMGYIKEISKKLAGIKNNVDSKNLKVYVIGFSNVDSDIDKLQTIKDYISPHVQQVTTFEATSDDELEKVFDGIRQTILEDFWHIYGPKE